MRPCIVRCQEFCRDKTEPVIHPETGGRAFRPQYIVQADLFRQLVLGLPETVIVSRDGVVAFANPAACALWSAGSAYDLIGARVDDLFHGDSLAARHARFADLAAGRMVPPFEDRIVRRDGGVFDVEIALSRLDSDGTAPPAMVFTMREISERKRAEAMLRESEERLTLALAGAQEGVWDWNLVTGDVVYSRRWTQMLGYGDDEIEPHVSAWERLLHPDDMARAHQVNDSVARGAQSYEGEFRLRHKDGHYVQVLSRGFPVRREPGGPVTRIVGTHFDLTERRKAEAERARTELLSRLVFAQEDERRRIAREMHDQFGEQLTALGRAIDAMKEACAGSPVLSAQVATLEKISRQIDRDVDQLVWQLRPTALDDLGLRAALANYVQDWSRRVSIPAELHVSGLLDDRLAPDIETTLYRVAQEALTNVARHSQASRVEVILERQAEAVLLIVEDNGVGFEAGAQPPGEGFGLLGMQERAALVGATVEIESTPGKGTTIFLRMRVDA
jgi:two-component system sensor histidine kinase UhpB